MTAAKRSSARSSPLLRSASEPVGLEPSKLRAVRVHEMLLRFAFGFGVSVVAGLVTVVLGDRLGGLFLAFPAILPASLTLIEQKDGGQQARIDAAGATIGATALVFFAATSASLVMHVPVTVAESAALAVWIAVAAALYALIRALIRAQ